MITATDNMKPAMWCPGINHGHSLARDLVLFAPLWEGAGNPHDLSISRCVITRPATATWGVGKHGPHVSMNGDPLSVANDPAWGVLDDFTVAIFTAPGVVGISQRPIHTYDGDGFYIGTQNWGGGDGLYSFVLFAGGGSVICQSNADTHPTIGQWDLVAGRRHGSDVSLIVNGVTQSDTETRSGQITNAAVMLIATGYTGDVGLVAVWRRALTDNELRSLYINPFPLMSYNPKTYYRLQNARGFHIYDNAGAGVVDYDTRKAVKPFDVTSYESGALTYPGTWRFGARSFNENGEEKNLTVKKLELDSSGKDATARPNEPASLTATPTAGGKIQLAWTYSSMAEGATPTKFNIYLTAADAIDYSSVHDTETKTTGEVTTYTWESSALTDGTLYTVAVRASTADVEDLNARVLTATADNTAPTQPASITASEDL